jgi:hypothetical protein
MRSIQIPSGWFAALVAAVGVFALSGPPAAAQTSSAASAAIRQATFQIRNEVKIKVPEAAQRVRVWLALPQENDPAQQVRDLKIEAPYPFRFERDSEGSRIAYLEASNPKEREITVVQTFAVTRSEVRDRIDPSRSRPLTDAERAQSRSISSPTSTW